MWEKKALKEAVYSKAEQAAAFEKGIVSNISYDYFLKEMKKENQRREDMLSQGKILYGLREYTEKTFFDYTQSNIRIQLKEALARTDMRLDEETIRVQYESMKQEMFHEGCDMRVEIVYCSPEQFRQPISEHKCADVCEEKLRKVLEKGNLKESVRVIKGVNYKELLLYSTDQNSEEYWRYWMYQNLKDVQDGEEAKIYSENDRSFILQCIEKKDKGYRSFESAKNTIQQMYVEEHYDDYIAGLCSL